MIIHEMLLGGATQDAEHAGDGADTRGEDRSNEQRFGVAPGALAKESGKCYDD